MIFIGFISRKSGMIFALSLFGDLNEKGAFYFFIDCRQTFTKITPNGMIINNSLDLSRYLLEEAHVAVVAGSAFGELGEGFFRISYATSNEKLEQAFLRIRQALEGLSSF